MQGVVAETNVAAGPAIPSSPILQACRKTPSPSGCSFRRTPCRLLRRMLASVALRTSIGSRPKVRAVQLQKVEGVEEEPWASFRR